MLGKAERRLRKGVKKGVIRLSLAPFSQAMTLRLAPSSQAMTLRLSPFSGEAESNSHKAKADDHIPGANTWDWIGSLADVENYDPEQTDQKVSNHHWG